MTAKEMTKGIVVWHNFHKCHYTVLEESNDFIGCFIANREDDKLNTYTVCSDDVCLSSKEMFEKLGFRHMFETEFLLRYNKDSHGDGDYEYVEFNFMWKEYEHGYYDGYGTKENKPTGCDIQLHQAITQKMKELGWLE